MGEFSRILGLGTLASLPLWLGALGVVLAARDLTEVAAAAIAGAVAITLIGLLALAISARRGMKVAREHDLYLKQSLALVDCMKEINRRVMDIESRKEDASDALPALAVTTDLAMPQAMNDAPVVAAVSAPAPAPVSAARPVAVQLKRALPAPLETPVYDLASGEAAGLRLTLPADLTSEEAGRVLAAALALRDDRPLELVLPGDAAMREVVLEALVPALADTPNLATGLLLGVSEPQLKASGAAQMRLIATLVRAGAHLCLTDVADLDLTGERLRASGIIRVSLEAHWLTGQLAGAPERVARWCTDLAAHEVTIMALNVPHRRMAMLLAAFDVALGAGPGAGVEVPPVTAPIEVPAETPAQEKAKLLPWRAMPRRLAS